MPERHPRGRGCRDRARSAATDAPADPAGTRYRRHRPVESGQPVPARWTRRRKRARRFRFFRRRRVGPVGKVRNMGGGNVVALFSVWFAGLGRFQAQPVTLPSKMRVVIRPAGVGLERERLGHRFQSPRYDVPPRRIGRGAAGAVSGDIEPVLGARHGNIEKTPVFLVLAVALLGGKPLGGTFAYPRPGATAEPRHPVRAVRQHHSTLIHYQAAGPASCRPE